MSCQTTGCLFFLWHITFADCTETLPVNILLLQIYHWKSSIIFLSSVFCQRMQSWFRIMLQLLISLDHRFVKFQANPEGPNRPNRKVTVLASSAFAQLLMPWLLLPWFYTDSALAGGVNSNFNLLLCLSSGEAWNLSAGRELKMHFPLSRWVTQPQCYSEECREQHWLPLLQSRFQN